MRLLCRLNALPPLRRRLLKTAILGGAVLAVCFPHLPRLVRHIERWRSPNRLIEAHSPALDPLIAELEPLVAAAESRTEALRIVQRYVYRRLPYAWDWEVWGNADYIPTVAEAVAAGREDCDGRAVVAASLLRRLGYQADLMTDFVHVWVRTEYGDTMSPGQREAVAVSDSGLAVRPTAAAQLMRSAPLGISVFPVYRELVVVVVLWLMMLAPGQSRRRAALVLALLIAALFLLRVRAAGSVPRTEISIAAGWFHAAGVVAIAAAWLTPWPGRGRRSGGRAPSPPCVAGGAAGEGDAGAGT